MKELKKPNFIPASDFVRGKFKVFNNSDDVLVRYAVRCSAAAPTYFTPVDGRFADSGLWADSPAPVGLAGRHGVYDFTYPEKIGAGANGRGI
jgi:predicted acylesterase/phospholipase RssA